MASLSRCTARRDYPIAKTVFFLALPGVGIDSPLLLQSKLLISVSIANKASVYSLPIDRLIAATTTTLSISLATFSIQVSTGNNYRKKQKLRGRNEIFF
jgi:hypothetical protein